MIINDLLQKKNISRYRLSKESGIPMTTIVDICSGKADIGRCSADTLYKIGKALGVTVDFMLEETHKEKSTLRSSFEVFKSNICHRVKDLGDIDFIITTLEGNEIRVLYEKQWYRESMYLLAMLDYLSRVNSIPSCTDYDDIRKQKLEKPLFPEGLILEAAATGNSNIKEEALANAIPEFLRFNIVESEVRDVC